MSTLTKVFIVLNAVFTLALSALTVAGAAQWSNAKDEIQKRDQLLAAEFTARANLESVMAMKLAMKDDQLGQAQTALQRANDGNRSLADDLASSKNDLARRTNEKEAAEAGRKKLEEILGVQTAELTALQKNNQTLFTSNTDLQTRNQRQAARILELSAQVTVANDNIRNLQEKLFAAERQNEDLQRQLASGRRAPSETVGVAGAQPVKAAVAGPIRGEVTKVDGAYASINVGESSGVQRGMTFMVYRGDKYLADLEIDNVWPKEAGGKLRTVVGDIRAGDLVGFGL